MSSLLKNHLRTYVEDSIQQKVRLGNLINDYKKQENKTRERVIDQEELIARLKLQNISQEKIERIIKRKEHDEDILKEVKEAIDFYSKEIQDITFTMNAHLEELSEMEIESGGFVAHSVGVDLGAEFDKESKVIMFKENGRVEIPIAAKLKNWKDSSQLTIHRIKKAGT